MKKKIFIPKNNTKNQKKLYFILIGLALLSFIFGCLFIFMISEGNVSYIKDNLVNYFNNADSSLSLFFKSLFNNYIYLLVIWILGISIIGIPIVIFMFLFKYFIFGFSLSSILSSFGFNGILLSLINLMPHKLMYLVVLLLVSFYSISFSIKIFKNFFLKRPINFRESMNKYFKILLISLVVTLFISLYEGFISNNLVNFFYK